MMHDAAAIAVLEGDELPALVDRVDSCLLRYGPDVVPAAIQAVQTMLGPTLAPLRPLLVDCALGTRRARRMGKGIGGVVFTQRAAEQATHPAIARWHATLLAGACRVVEVCTGAGMDLMAMADAGMAVTSFEADAVTAALARGNVRRHGGADRVVIPEAVPCAAYAAALDVADAVWADPSRRDADGRRTRDGDGHQPPLGVIEAAAGRCRVGIKLGPADRLPERDGWADVWVAYGAECRERVRLYGVDGWAGTAVVAVDHARRWDVPVNAGTPACRRPAEGDVLLEPHAAILASGATAAFAAAHGWDMLDERVGYALAAPGTTNPWCAAFDVVAVDDGTDQRRMRQRVRDFGWGPDSEVKKRGSALDPVQVHRSLPWVPAGAAGATGAAGVVILVRTTHASHTIYALRRTRYGEVR